MKHIETLLTEMTIEQKAPIVKILGLKSNNNKLINEKLSKILLPVGGFLQTPLNYNQFVEKIATANNEKIDFSLGIASAEKELYLKLFQQEFEKLTEEEKDNINKELEKAGLDKTQIKSLSGISALGAAQLSGFGIYLLASSTLGAITSIIGITLPFAFYTGMSSVISFVIGPVGFLVMGVLVYRSFKNVKSWDEAFDLLKASWNGIKTFAIGDTARSALVFKYFAATRIVLTENLRNQIKENSSLIKIKKVNISKIEIEINHNENEIDLLKVKIDNFKNRIKEKINDKKLIANDILNSENASKLKLSKIEKLNK
ncbi:hypothetical protein [Psychroserpens sp. NJDZ02]|uniref:hypothetical protein n=1 Tax=Psychroserpens sp. NJDZ02 TaxID=2570561 RepID=UPI0010A9374B|nr:hypothetical protein [Psychroserpens sp. NJDZ02]QCE40229.1 hypothetical protein E9099_01920 [Psychroserpens sp. NJDZ02]